MNLVDRTIGYFSPGKLLQREQARFKLRMISTFAPAFDGASRSKRGLKSWIPGLLSPDAEQSGELETLTARSRDLYRNNPIGRSSIRTTVTNAVGSGLLLKCAIDNDYLNLPDEVAEAWENQVERYFRLWCKADHCDAGRMQAFGEKQGLALLSTLHSGDVFATLPKIPRKGSPFDLRVQLIEGDRVCNENFQPDTDRLFGGIRTDAFGAPLEYHILKTHPGGLDARIDSWVKIPAFGRRSGRRNVLHLLVAERPGQRRGLPFLTPVIESLRLLGEYSNAELMAALVSGLFTVFIKSEGGGVLENFVPEEQQDPGELNLGNGAIVDLLPGESIETANPARPNSQFDDFIMAVTRQIGAALEIPYEVLIKHFTASYSASRAALLEAWKFFKVRRTWLATNFCQPIYEEFLSELILSGKISAPGFFEDPLIREAYSKALWIGPSQGQIDPVKETKAAQMRIDSALSTRETETATIGGDWEANYRQLVTEKRMLIAGDLENNPTNESTEIENEKSDQED